MVTYTLRRYKGGASVPCAECKRKRRDAAALRFCRMVYDTVKSNAGLDTHAGHKAMNTAHLAYQRDRATVSVEYRDQHLTFCVTS